MGVDLGGLCTPTPVSIDGLSGKVVAIDAYNTLYQFLAIIRGPDGTPLRDHEGRVTSHLNGLFNRTANFVEAGIEPLFVFDGAPHPLKLRTLDERRRIKEKAVREYEEALSKGDLETARSKAQQTSTLSKEMVDQAKQLLQALGIPCLVAPSDGEGQASVLVRDGRAFAVVSQDFDSLLFGAPRLVRNLAVTGRRKMPGKSAWSEVEPERIDLEAALATHGVSREQLIDIAILIGTDFNPGIVGIGPKKALKLVQENLTIERILERAPREEGDVWKKVEAGRAGIEDHQALRKIFLEPPVLPDPKIEWGRLDAKGVTDLLVGEHRFSQERVRTALERYKTAPMYRKQKSLADWV